MIAAANDIGILSSFKGRRLRHYWPYCEPDGTPFGYTARYDGTDSSKEVVPYFRRDGKGFKLGGANKPRRLFGLDVLARADNERPVFVFEGEKKCAAAHSLEMVAVTSCGGAMSAHTADWEPLNNRKLVYIFPDNDSAGTAYATSVLTELKKLPLPPSVVIVNLPGIGEGEDFCDWLKRLMPQWDGFQPVPESERDRLRSALKRVIREQTDIKVPKEGVEETSRSIGRSGAVSPLNLQQFLGRDIPPRNPLLGSWLLERMPVLVSGEAGCGKSLFCYSLVYAVASGSEFLGWAARRPRRVGIIDGEMSDSTIQRRIAGILKGMNPNADPDFVKLLTRDMCYELEKDFPDLRDKNERAKTLDGFDGVDLLLVDNVNCCFGGGNESSTEFWVGIEDFFWECRRREMAVILVHHTTKSNLKSPAGSSKNVRICEASVILERVGNCVDGAHFNLSFGKFRELAADASPRSAKVITDDGGSRWHHGPEVLSEGDRWVPEAMRLHQDGMSYRAIQDKLGISKSTIQTKVKAVQMSMSQCSGQPDNWQDEGDLLCP